MQTETQTQPKNNDSLINGFPYVYGIDPCIYHQMQVPESVEDAQTSIHQLKIAALDIKLQIEQYTAAEIGDKYHTEKDWVISAIHKKRIYQKQILLLIMWIRRERKNKERILNTYEEIEYLKKRIKALENTNIDRDKHTAKIAEKLQTETQERVRETNRARRQSYFLLKMIYLLLYENQFIKKKSLKIMMKEFDKIPEILQRKPDWGNDFWENREE